MSTFPTLIPSVRIFTPGGYPHSAFTGMSGIQGRVRNSNVMLSSQVRLTFAAITESQMLSILTHYQGRQGTFQSFSLTSAIWNGVSSVSDYQLTSYGWRYIEPPSVTDAMCANAYDVELTLETVPPEGTAIAGLDFFVRTTLAAGTATGQFNFNVAVSLSSGIATAGAAMPGLDESVIWSLAEGSLSYRYYRLGNFAATNLDSNRLDISEIELYDDNTKYTDLTCTVSFSLSIGTSSQLVDGDTSESSRASKGSWDGVRSTATITFDLGTSGNVTHIKVFSLYTQPRFPGSFVLSGSNDNSSFTEISTVTVGTNFTSLGSNVYSSEKVAI